LVFLSSASRIAAGDPDLSALQRALEVKGTINTDVARGVETLSLVKGGDLSGLSLAQDFRAMNSASRRDTPAERRNSA
jgi:phage head maturation protease